MKTKKFMKTTLLLLFIFFISVSCSNGNSIVSAIAKGNVALKATATINNTGAKIGAASKTNTTTGTTISSFKINIKNIEFHKKENEDSNTVSSDSIYEDTKLMGPFELDLASGNTSIDVATVDIPDNVYDKVKFELHKSKDTTSTIFGKSIEIKGDINGNPFVFWTDAEEEMAVKFNISSNTPVRGIVVTGTQTNTTTINFNLTTIFGPTSTIDFSTAVDGNGDGVIEISPDNVDGNADLAKTIKDMLEQETDLEND